MEPVEAAETTADETVALSVRPVIVDLGKKKGKAIRNLKQGTGSAMLEVEDAINQVRLHLPEADRNKPMVPVVLIYERKRNRPSVSSVPFSPLNLFR